MAHLMTILLFLAMGGAALAVILDMMAEYADRIAALLGVEQPKATGLLPAPLPRRTRVAMRPAPVRREARLRAAA